jgi:prevent-host-death family protein
MIMATTAVGVRDLKLHAPKLVGRAARGERIVISRYGRPQAVLGPIEQAPPDATVTHGPRMAEWLEEKRSFEQLLPGLETKHRGRYVAIRGGRVIGSDVDPDQLFERLWAKLSGRTFFIGRVGGPPLVEMPGFEVEE